VKKVTSKTTATGPRTEKGKLRSALNATRHGLAGRGLLLPGEDAARYQERLDGVFAALAPQDDAQAEVVALVGDDLHKLNRLAEIERGVTLGRIEQLLGLTDSAEKAGIIGNAITVMGSALVAWSEQPIPTEKDDAFTRRFRTMAGAVAVVEATVTDISSATLETCNELLTQLHGRRGEAEVPQAAYAELFQAARQLLTDLLDRGHAQDAAQDELRAAIAGIALPDKEELAKLARYRSMLETSLQRRLGALEQLRRLSAGMVAGQADAEKAKEYRVKLRVVA
jgi:hypothetical protein